MMLTKNNGKWALISLLSFSLFFSSSIFCEERETLTPYSFYQGIELGDNSNHSPFGWLELPSEAYLNSAHPKTLQDVRVFDGIGQEVPSALFYDTKETSKILQTYFSLQRLIVRTGQANLKNEARHDSQYLLVEAIPGKVSRIKLPSAQLIKDAVYQSYLLTRNENNKAHFPAQTLYLDWVNSDKNWQAQTFIYASEDKQKWVNVLTNQPVMNLNASIGIIENSTNAMESLSGNNMILNAPYLMIITVGSKNSHIPDLKSAFTTAKVTHTTRRQEISTFVTHNEGVSLNQLIYRLPSPQPLKEIVIQLQQQNHVLPLFIEYTSDAGENWLPLTHMVVYNQIGIGEQTHNPALILNDKVIKKLRITALQGSWDDNPPLIEGKRDASNIIFNMQGASPYLLVWGNYLADTKNISYRELINKPLTTAELMHQYPELHSSHEIIELGEKKQLKANSSNDHVHDWLVIALWCLLGVGVAALLYFCWYLLREINSKNSKR
ncbi:hypothetical protein M2263_001306 [Providencia alcalifaciens]|nr:hypothetical protein [Providencia alcalifaciens]